MDKKYKGVVVPMVSPFTATLQADGVAVAKIVSYLAAHDCHPFVLGTTGEAASISQKNRLAIVKAAATAIQPNQTLYAGISSNCLDDALTEAKQFADLGVNVLVSTMPSYYPVDDHQILTYFDLLANQITLPLVIYNIPATTHLSIPLAIADELSLHPNIVGFKDSEKGEDRVRAAIERWKDREDFSYLLGWALMSQEAMLLGADGIVPSTGNISPGIYQAIYQAVKVGDANRAMAAQKKADAISAIYQKDRILSRSLPALKTMMSAYDLCGPTSMPPFVEVTDDESKQIINYLRGAFGDMAQINHI